MTGKSHLAANGAICFALLADPVMGSAAILSSKVPDQAEKFMPWVRHRTVTHHLYFWGAMAALFYFVPLTGIFPGADPRWGSFLCGIFLGGFLHVVMDMFSKSGVPIVPGKTWGARFYTTGRYSEYLFLGAVLLICSGAFAVRHPEILPLVKTGLGF